MSTLDKVHTGKRKIPPRIMIYGTEGIGKSTFASQAPEPIFIPTEDGLSEIDCASFPLARKLADVRVCLEALAIENHNYQTLVIDSLDWLEKLIWKQICIDEGVGSIEKVGGGYGKGYVRAAEIMTGILDMLNALRIERGLLILLIAHAKVERFEDPESSAYDRYSPRLNKHTNAAVTEWSDAVLFATRDMVTRTEETGFGKKRTIASGKGIEAGGERVLRTIGCPSCVAKNRYGLPFQIPLSWDAFMGCLNNNQNFYTGDNNDGKS